MAGRDESTEAQSGSIGWQEAVLRLSAERGRAENAARLLKQLGDKAAVDHGRLIYGDGRAEVDALIDGLLVALAQGEGPSSLPELEARLQRAVEAREALSALVKPLLLHRMGEKDLPIAELIEMAGAIIPSLLEAVRTLWVQVRDADRLKAETIRTQLEAARWRDFAAIPA